MHEQHNAQQSNDQEGKNSNQHQSIHRDLSSLLTNVSESKYLKLDTQKCRTLEPKKMGQKFKQELPIKTSKETSHGEAPLVKTMSRKARLCTILPSKGDQDISMIKQSRKGANSYAVTQEGEGQQYEIFETQISSIHHCNELVAHDMDDLHILANL